MAHWNWDIRDSKQGGWLGARYTKLIRNQFTLFLLHDQSVCCLLHLSATLYKLGLERVNVVINKRSFCHPRVVLAHVWVGISCYFPKPCEKGCVRVSFRNAPLSAYWPFLARRGDGGGCCAFFESFLPPPFFPSDSHDTRMREKGWAVQG